MMQSYLEHIRRQQADRQRAVNHFRDLFLVRQLTSTSYVDSLKNEAAGKFQPRPSPFAQILVPRILQSDNHEQQRSEWLLKLPKLAPEPQADLTFGQPQNQSKSTDVATAEGFGIQEDVTFVQSQSKYPAFI
jgi:hypothetical protein